KTDWRWRKTAWRWRKTQPGVGGRQTGVRGGRQSGVGGRQPGVGGRQPGVGGRQSGVGGRQSGSRKKQAGFEGSEQDGFDSPDLLGNSIKDNGFGPGFNGFTPLESRTEFSPDLDQSGVPPGPGLGVHSGPGPREDLQSGPGQGGVSSGPGQDFQSGPREDLQSGPGQGGVDSIPGEGVDQGSYEPGQVPAGLNQGTNIIRSGQGQVIGGGQGQVTGGGQGQVIGGYTYPTPGTGLPTGPGVNTAGHTGPGVNTAGHTGPGVNTVGQTGPGVNTAGHTGPGVNTAGQTGPGVNTAGQTGPGVNTAGQTGAGVNTAGHTGPGVNTAGQTGAGVNTAGHTGPGVNTAGLKDVVSLRVNLQPVATDDDILLIGSQESTSLQDNQDQYQDNQDQYQDNQDQYQNNQDQYQDNQLQPQNKQEVNEAGVRTLGDPLNQELFLVTQNQVIQDSQKLFQGRDQIQATQELVRGGQGQGQVQGTQRQIQGNQSQFQGNQGHFQGNQGQSQGNQGQFRDNRGQVQSNIIIQSSEKIHGSRGSLYVTPSTNFNPVPSLAPITIDQGSTTNTHTSGVSQIPRVTFTVPSLTNVVNLRGNTIVASQIESSPSYDIPLPEPVFGPVDSSGRGGVSTGRESSVRSDLILETSYVPPTKEFTPSSVDSSQQAAVLFVTGVPSREGPFSVSPAPVSLTDSLKQEVVSPAVTQQQQTSFTVPRRQSTGTSISQQRQTSYTVPRQQNILSSITQQRQVTITVPRQKTAVSVNQQGTLTFSDPRQQNKTSSIKLSALQQGYLPPVNSVSQVNTTITSPSRPGDTGSSPGPQVFPSGPANTASGTQRLSSSSSGSSSFASPSASVSYSLTPTSSSSANLSVVPPSLSQSLSSSLSGSVNQQQGRPIILIDSNSIQSGAPGGVVLPLEQHYLPPSARDVTRNTRHVARDQHIIYVTPVPPEDRRKTSRSRHLQESITGRRSFHPSVQITSRMNNKEFLPKTSSQQILGRVFFPSNHRSDVPSITYVDNSRKSFAATSSFPVNPFNQYKLSWRPSTSSQI
ncbi:Ribosome-binding protein 1-like 6, partial [Homarus americanus]